MSVDLRLEESEHTTEKRDDFTEEEKQCLHQAYAEGMAIVGPSCRKKIYEVAAALNKSSKRFEKLCDTSKFHCIGLHSNHVGVLCCIILAFTTPVFLMLGFSMYSDLQYATITMPPGHFLCYTGEGRLGNQMFRFASLTGIANKNNFVVIISKNDPLYQIFDLKNVLVLEDRKVCDTFKLVEEASCCSKFDKNLMTLPTNQNYTVGYYLQSWKYFIHVQDEIRQQFQFKNHTKDKVSSIMKNVRSRFVLKSPIIIGIHIRMGDLVKEKMYYNTGIVVAPEEYIYKAMDYMKDKFPELIFVVASNDLQWSKKTLGKRTNDNMYFLNEDNAPEVDLATLASCDHVILTVGTFGWWAGYLAGGISVYYPHPARIGSKAEFQYNYGDYYPPQWIGLDV